MRFYAFLTVLLFCVSMTMATHNAYNTAGSSDTGQSIINTNLGLGVISSGNGIEVLTPGIGVMATSNSTGGLGVYGIGANGVVGHGTPDGYGTALGVEGQSYSDGESGTAYGTHGDVYNCTYCYSVYGMSPYGTMGTDNWSGYFEGDVYVGGSFSNPSDIMFKKNIRSLDGGLNKVMSLKPKSYEMKTEEFKDRVYLPKGDKFGLIAQEVETVLPELVHPVTAQSRRPLTKDGKIDINATKGELTHFKSVDYMGLIPILVEAIQELKIQVDSLKAIK